MLATQTAEYSVKDIVKSFGGAKALAGVSMSVSSEEVHCLAGENGSGKSTLIKIMPVFSQKFWNFSFRSLCFFCHN